MQTKFYFLKFAINITIMEFWPASGLDKIKEKVEITF